MTTPKKLLVGNPEDLRPRLAINRCLTHGTYSISIDSGRSGSRVTPGKCCGRWGVVKEWALTWQQWRDLSAEAENAAIIAGRDES